MNYEVLNRFIEKYGEIEGPRKYRWHCNPKIYSDDYLNPKHKLASKIWVNDDNKKQLAISRGYDVFIIWESDWVNNETQVIEDVKHFINKEDR